ncbi:EAL domain-containing response regulator [Pseudoduganella sp. OTU4001]|uniref:EAL domain-containing response regulator n=1 Tax=Pseudoduganella sp. OTU4001 TaxID=3043854 RepID=UPI00313C969B
MDARTLVVAGRAAARQQLQAQCGELGLQVVATADSGNAALDSLEALPQPIGLLALDASLPDMDVTDFLLSLSTRGCEAGVLLTGLACPRLCDTVTVLAASLGLRTGAAESLPKAFAALPPAAGKSPTQPGAAPRCDALDIRYGLLRGEFELYYQPKVAMANRQLRGVEGLLRWHHPRHGLLSPAAFLPCAEAAGLAELLTTKVLQLALGDWQAWRAQSRPVPISINLSPLVLANPHFAEQLIDTVQRAAVPPSSLILEITEHTEIADLSTALRNLLKLRLHGFQLSLDDYGAGHASILQLSRIPFGELKLDRRLVHGAWQRPHLRILLAQAIHSAHALGLSVVAEGIECQQDWDLMHALGCDMAQGYLIGRPMPALSLAKAA